MADYLSNNLLTSMYLGTSQRCLVPSLILTSIVISYENLPSYFFSKDVELLYGCEAMKNIYISFHSTCYKVKNYLQRLLLV